jgi:hypothetical protein
MDTLGEVIYRVLIACGCADGPVWEVSDGLDWGRRDLVKVEKDLGN